MSVGRRREAAVDVITLDRPAVLNAFDEDTGAAALEALRDAAADDAVRCIVITGAGRAFCAGADLQALEAGYRAGEVPDLGRALRDLYNPLIRVVRAAPKPVVAAVNGVAAGAGASLALACDFRIATESASLVLAFVKIGLVPDSGALWFLTRMLGASKAWQLCALGERVSALEAEAAGLFHQVVKAEEFEPEWLSFAARLADGPTRAYSLIKRLAQDAVHLTLDEQLEREVEAQTEAGRTGDHLEGVRAFLERRAPKFRGE